MVVILSYCPSKKAKNKSRDAIAALVESLELFSANPVNGSDSAPQPRMESQSD